VANGVPAGLVIWRHVVIKMQTRIK